MNTSVEFNRFPVAVLLAAAMWFGTTNLSPAKQSLDSENGDLYEGVIDNVVNTQLTPLLTSDASQSLEGQPEGTSSKLNRNVFFRFWESARLRHLETARMLNAIKAGVPDLKHRFSVTQINTLHIQFAKADELRRLIEVSQDSITANNLMALESHLAEYSTNMFSDDVVVLKANERTRAFRLLDLTVSEAKKQISEFAKSLDLESIDEVIAIINAVSEAARDFSNDFPTSVFLESIQTNDSRLQLAETAMLDFKQYEDLAFEDRFNMLSTMISAIPESKKSCQAQLLAELKEVFKESLEDDIYVMLFDNPKSDESDLKVKRSEVFLVDIGGQVQSLENAGGELKLDSKRIRRTITRNQGTFSNKVLPTNKTRGARVYNVFRSELKVALPFWKDFMAQLAPYEDELQDEFKLVQNVLELFETHKNLLDITAKNN